MKEDVEGILTRWRACLATGEIFEYETRVRRADGEYRWMFHRKVPLHDANGNIVKWYGSSLDIEERKTAEEQLRHNAEELQRSEFYLAEGQRLAHTGSWTWNVRTGALFWSEEIFRIYGYSPQETGPAFGQWITAKRADGEEFRTYRGLNLHDLRRSAVRRMVRSGVSETVAMEISGHSTRKIFDLYDISSDRDKREAAGKIASGPKTDPGTGTDTKTDTPAFGDTYAHS
jgi:PAS domain-containing protein